MATSRSRSKLLAHRDLERPSIAMTLERQRRLARSGGAKRWREAVARGDRPPGEGTGRGQWRTLPKGYVSMHPLDAPEGPEGKAPEGMGVRVAALGRGSVRAWAALLGGGSSDCLRKWWGTWTRENTCPSPALCSMRTRCFRPRRADVSLTQQEGSACRALVHSRCVGGRCAGRRDAPESSGDAERRGRLGVWR